MFLSRILGVSALALALAPGVRAQCELQKLTASDGAAYDGFSGGILWGDLDTIVAETVAISGDTILVGAPWHDEVGAASGAAYVFRRSGGSWVQEAKLVPGDAAAGDSFGFCVALDGRTAAIGAPFDQDAGPQTGAVYVFQRKANGWVQAAKLTASDATQYDWFGNFVEVSGARVLVGAMMHDELGQNSGAAYVFEDSPNGWVETAKLVPSDGALNDQFGVEGGLSGDFAVVGAWHDGDAGFNSGAAYVFERKANGWQQVDKLIPGDASPNDRLGSSVDLQDDRVLLGARFDDHSGTGFGVAYLFQRTPNGWVEEAQLTPSDGEFGDFFGVAVALTDGRALVGASRRNEADYWSGSAYLFEEMESGWVETEKLVPGDGALGDFFGMSVAIVSGTAVVGSPGDDDLGDESGSAYLFHVANDIGDNYCGPANLNSTGMSAEVFALGSSIVACNLLSLVATDLPPNQFGYFLASETQGFVPFAGGSQGNLCLAGNIARFVQQVQSSGPDGSFSISVDLTSIPTTPPHTVLAGETWNFQAWFRDVGNNSNFTDGVSILFQ